jgi:hypothetical protein
MPDYINDMKDIMRKKYEILKKVLYKKGQVVRENVIIRYRKIKLS